MNAQLNDRPTKNHWLRIGLGLLIAGACWAALEVLNELLFSSRRPPASMRCSFNLRQIQMALLNYESTYRRFPPAYTVDENGKRLHSWRALILPYLEHKAVYDQIQFSKPWDHPDNAGPRGIEINEYRCPSAKLPRGHTTYLAIVGELCAFTGSTPTKIASFKDGTSNTVMLYEAETAKSVHWMEPSDGDLQAFIDTFSDSNAANSPNYAHSSGANCALADGSIQFIARGTSEATLRAFGTRKGDEVIDAAP